MALTDKQAAFVQEYLIDLNATQAAIRAGYSEQTAAKIGSENLIKPEIQKAIQEAKEARAQRVEIDQDWVVKRLVAIAGADPRNVMAWNAGGVEVVDSDELEWADAYSVQEVSIRETIKEVKGNKANPDGELVLSREKRVKQADKLKAMELLMKHLGMGKETIQMIGDESRPPVQVTFVRPE